MKPTILFISCEHAVNTVPQAYAHLFHQHAAVLQTHRAIDFGAIEIATHLQRSLNCDHTTATITRLLIDCNRSLKHPSCFSEFTNSLSDTEKQQLIEQYYLPYRQQTEALIKEHIDHGNQVFHVSCHSFTPVFNGVTRNAGIGFLYDPAHHGEKEVAREWYGILSHKTDYRIRMNYPYRGKSDGFTSYLRKKYAERDYIGLELEVNQTLVNDKASLNTLANALSSSLSELLQLL